MKGPEGRSLEVESKHCLSTGRRPSDNRQCNLLPCARWATTHWGAVSLVSMTTNSVKAVYLVKTQSTSLQNNFLCTICKLFKGEVL